MNEKKNEKKDNKQRRRKRKEWKIQVKTSSEFSKVQETKRKK